MANSENLLADLTRRANDAFLAPFIVTPNIGLAAINATIGGTARIGEITAQTMGKTGVPFAEYAEGFSKRVADSTLKTAKKSVDLALDATRKAVGQGSETSANHLLAETVLDQTGLTGAVPFTVTFDAVAAALDFESFRRAAWDAWLVLTRFFDTLSIKGVIPGEVGVDTNATVRFGFYYMTTEGPLEAVFDDVTGILGGFLALGLGDFQYLSDALPNYWTNMEYVWDKKLNGEVQGETHFVPPDIIDEADFPIGEVLGNDGERTILRFPWEFRRALETGNPLEVLRASAEDFGLLWTLVTTYPSSEFRVVYDVLIFVIKAYVETGDAQNYALCELGIMESTLSNEQKDYCLALLRKTAGNDTIEFEYYVPLLVPHEDTGEPRAERRDAAGNVIPDRAIGKSVFKQVAINRAQSITSEVISLRSFLWLYGDEKVAREKNHKETIRKFGPPAAERIARSPMYPPTAEQVAALTKGGPRPRKEINKIFYDLLHKRGLLYVADLVASHLPAS